MREKQILGPKEMSKGTPLPWSLNVNGQHGFKVVFISLQHLFYCSSKLGCSQYTPQEKAFLRKRLHNSVITVLNNFTFYVVFVKDSA